MMSDQDALGNASVEGAVQAVLQRLNQMRRLWEQAADTYFSPEEFRLNLQNCITISRTVTFILQSNKKLIPNFDEWYENHVEK
jgi:alpha-D-ribose 1-methylphosphonate 5-triphosphate synthase subunit PhnL